MTRRTIDDFYSVDDYYAYLNKDINMPVCKNCLAYILKGHFCCGICQFNYMRVNMPTPEELMSTRGPIYGEARINLACTQELCDVFDKYYKANIRAHKDYDDDTINAHKAAIHLVLTKIARIANGAFHEDNYDDGATYLIIAKKIMKGESTLPEVPRRNAIPGNRQLDPNQT